MAFPILRALHGARRWVDHPEVLGHQTAGGLVGWWIFWVGFTVVNYQVSQ